MSRFKWSLSTREDFGAIVRDKAFYFIAGMKTRTSKRKFAECIRSVLLGMLCVTFITTEADGLSAMPAMKTPLFDKDGDPVFFQLKDWIAEIGTLGSSIIATREIKNITGVYFVCVSKTGPRSIGVFAYNVATHSIGHIGWEVRDMRGRPVAFKATGLLSKNYKIVEGNSGGTCTVVYGAGELFDPGQMGPFDLVINTGKDFPVETKVRFNLEE